MSFDVAAAAYGRFMGRFSEPLAAGFADLAGVRSGQVALDVGCGPGPLTAELVARLGVRCVIAIDPSSHFVEAVRARLPGVDARVGVAEQLPLADGSVDVTMAQLVVHFLSDPAEGVAEMRRVTRPGGVVAANVWDHASDRGGPLTAFYRAVADVDPSAGPEVGYAGVEDALLVDVFRAAGLGVVDASWLSITVPFATFDEWWSPFTLGVGPPGVYVAGLPEDHRRALRSRCAELLPPAPFALEASAWCVRADV
ncbi:MAG TPA: class I SAM-dependent methyltransferase [Actinotalea sp.]|nr:class I SAM-dependent methyltransferase [Actinotalea sp.]